MNPFENSFAKKDLLPRLGHPDTFSTSPLASGTDSTSHITNHETLTISNGDKLAGSNVPAANQGKPLAENTNGHFQQNQGPAGSNGSNFPNTNKHNLRILNFSSLDSERLPGLTPPLFTPGGRRLPPIQFSPGAALGSPGTPGHMWSSLLSATNGSVPQGQEQNPPYSNMLRKLGLTPNESNLRSGLTPSIMAQQGFNFNLNTPGGFLNGQMTPGLLNLLGLTNNVPVSDAGVNTVPVGGVGGNGTYVVPPSVPGPGPKHDEKETEPAKEEISSEDEASIKKETQESVKRTSSAGSRGSKRAKKEKKKEEPKKSSRAASEEEKRKQFLERNRVAASKCRQRKKQLLLKMESELSFYSSGYRELSVQVTQLRDQLLQLRGILINHRECPSLVNLVGGFPQLQSIIGLTDYIAQVAANSQPNYTSIPSTIPTTLNAQPVKSESPLSVGPQLEMSNGVTQGQIQQQVPQQQISQPQIQGQVNQGQVSQSQINQNQISQNQISQGQLNQNQINQSQIGQNQINQNQLTQGQLNQGQVSLVPISQVSLVTPRPPSNPTELNQNRAVQNGDISMQIAYPSDVDASTFQNDLAQNALTDLQAQNGNLRSINSTSNLQEKMGADNYGLRPVASMADLQHGAQQAVKQFDI